MSYTLVTVLLVVLPINIVMLIKCSYRLLRLEQLVSLAPMASKCLTRLMREEGSPPLSDLRFRESPLPSNLPIQDLQVEHYCLC